MAPPPRICRMLYAHQKAYFLVFSAFSSEKQSSLLLSSVTMSHKKFIEPYDRFITAGDTHERCVLCLGLSHAQAAFSSLSNCLHCDSLRLKVLRSRLAAFSKGPASNPRQSISALPRRHMRWSLGVTRASQSLWRAR